MTRTFVAPTAIAALLALAAAAPASDNAAGIRWTDTYEEAQERAVAETRVVFIAVNMDGEAANERMVDDVYADKKLVGLTEHTVNLVASSDRHARSGKCSRFECTSCDVHREVDIDVRREVLAPDASGAVIAPQHVFLAPDGGVLLSVPYEVSSLELQWCFGEAWRLAGADGAPKVSPEARRPRRLILGDVARLGRNSRAPLTRDQVLELIATHKKGGDREERRALLRDLVTADEPEARRYALDQLRAGVGGGRRGGGRNQEDARSSFLRWIGTASPASYHEVVVEFVNSGLESTRCEAIVALEQLGSPECLPLLLKALRKVKDERVGKNLLRAVGACGPADRKARAALLKASNDLKAPLARQSALIALGWMEPDEEVAERLRQAALPERFGEGARIDAERITPLEREAAVVAMGISRDEAWTELLQELADDGDEAQPLRDAAASALEVIGGGPYGLLRDSMMRAGEDEIPRDRLFPEGIARRR